jgi:hypothetical protein
LITGSELDILLKETEGWNNMSATQKEVWADELI